MAGCRFLCLAALLAIVAPTSDEALAQESFPVVIFQPEQLRAAGLQVDGDEPLKNKCYGYGIKGDVSVSDELLARYVRKGFTLESLCLGLVSGARFDPETGKRLPTYVMFDWAGLRRSLQETNAAEFRGRAPESLSSDELVEFGLDGFVYKEEPLVVPPCFKNGTPYSDCTWRYSIESGRRLSDQSVEKFRKLGASIDAAIRRAMSEAPACKPDSSAWPCHRESPRNGSGYKIPSFGDVTAYVNGHMLDMYPGHKPIPDALLKGQDTTFFDVAAAFPRGFGYALNARYDAEPGINLETMRHAAGAARLKSQVTKERLRRWVEE